MFSIHSANTTNHTQAAFTAAFSFSSLYSEKSIGIIQVLNGFERKSHKQKQHTKLHHKCFSDSTWNIHFLNKIIMTQARQLSLLITIMLWAIICGGIMYSHIVYFPPYLSHLPESNSLIRGEYGLQDSNFWLLVHPAAILSTIITLILNWKLKARRKFIFTSLSIYVLVIIATAVYFVPGLMAFADSTNNTTVTPAEWLQRGQTWQHMSWIRGAFMYLGFLLIVMALIKDNPANDKSQKH